MTHFLYKMDRVDFLQYILAYSNYKESFLNSYYQAENVTIVWLFIKQSELEKQS